VNIVAPREGLTATRESQRPDSIDKKAMAGVKAGVPKERSMAFLIQKKSWEPAAFAKNRVPPQSQG